MDKVFFNGRFNNLQDVDSSFDKTAAELDFYRIRSLVAQNAASDEGREFFEGINPSTDFYEVERRKAMGREWNSYIGSTRPQAISYWPPVKKSFELLGKEGAQLSAAQFFSLAQFFTCCTKAVSLLQEASTELKIPELLKASSSIDKSQLDMAAKKIFSVIDSDGNVKDLPELREIRNRISSLRKEAENALRRYTSDTRLSGILQSNVPVLKGGKELLAVRWDKKSEVSGIIHEVSSSGQTVFIEVEEAVKANNSLVQAQYELEEKIRTILRNLTLEIGFCRESARQAHSAMILLDTTFACARWQKSVHGVFAENCDLQKEPPSIKGARHPLLGDKAIPVDINFMDGKRVLIITGPNTGGKTVTLKTIALFALMNQAAFPLPADEGTRLPYFDRVFADIGDEQSIDESLSTFSAHMKKIASMEKHATEKSLVLLDELASGTDPQEGGAIAMAALDEFIERKSFVIVTTHHGILKNYGYTNHSCVNASVEFDQQTLSPTYRLMMGVPGESHAIDIAMHSGLSKKLIQKAKEYISTQQADVSALIKGLTAKHEEMDALIREQKDARDKLAIKEVELSEREIEAKQREIELRELEAKQNFASLREARSRLENLVRELREGEITREKNLKVRQFIKEFEEEAEKKESQIEEERLLLEKQQDALKEKEAFFAENGIKFTKESRHSNSSKSSKKTKRRISNTEALKSAKPIPKEENDRYAKKTFEQPKKIIPQLAPGVEVLAGRERRKGTLVQKEKNGESWSVQFGAIRMSVPTRQLQAPPLEGTGSGQTQAIQKADYVLESAASSEGDSRPQFELRLLGMRYEDAIKSLERQIDLCTITNFANFSIIHGKGSGILQQGVHDYLSHHPAVKDFHFARPEDGGTGKTYVELHT